MPNHYNQHYDQYYGGTDDQHYDQYYGGTDDQHYNQYYKLSWNYANAWVHALALVNTNVFNYLEMHKKHAGGKFLRNKPTHVPQNLDNESYVLFNRTKTDVVIKKRRLGYGLVGPIHTGTNISVETKFYILVIKKIF